MSSLARTSQEEEPEASEAILEALKGDGTEILLNAETVQAHHDETFTLTLRDGSQLEADQLLLTTGRVPNFENLGLRRWGSRRPALLSATISASARDCGDRRRDRKGRVHPRLDVSVGHRRRQVLGQPDLPSAFHAVPHVTFTDPEVGSVGLTERAADALDIRVSTRRADLGSRSFIHGTAAENGFVKLVVDADKQVLVGATAVGSAASEVLSMLTLAVHAEIPIATLRSMIYAYPTFHRAVGAALVEL